jgi:hypothetical protein
MPDGMPSEFASSRQTAKTTGSGARKAVNQTELIVEISVVLVESPILQEGNSLTQCLLEFNYAGLLLIETFSLLDALDVGAERFSQIDCGEYLHERTYDVPTILLSLEVSVGDIRHSGFPTAADALLRMPRA